MNYEVCKGGLHVRGTVKKKSDIKLEPTSEEFYLSLFGFDNSIYEHLDVNRDPSTGKTSVSGFAGSYYGEYLYFDIDRDGDLPGSLDSTRDLVKRLYARFQLSPKRLLICFSGSKGFHVGIHQSHFGGFAPSPQLPAQVQVLAGRLLAECHGLTLAELKAQAWEVKQAGGQFADIDLGIYNNNRIFRVINSFNPKGPRYKVGVTSTELLTLPLEEILALADHPRPDFKTEESVVAGTPHAELAGLWEYARTFDVAAFEKSTSGARSGLAGTGSIDRDFFGPPQQGERDNTFFKQACHLFDRGVYETHVLQILASINQVTEPPLPDTDLRRIVKSAFTRTQRNQAQAQASVLTPEAAEGELELLPQWNEEWLDYYTQKPSPMTCVVKEIDEDQEQNLKGKLGVFLGQGGTRKSYFVQNLIVRNVLELGNRFIYSSMEMGKVEAVNRFLDMFFESGEPGLTASRSLQQQARANKEATRELLRTGSAPVSDQLILDSRGGKTSQDYEKMIQETVRLYGSLDGLVVDGLSAMGGKGEETERFGRITLELKELAKRYNIFIALICHTTKACTQHTRDARAFVRGSEKILDNSDFTVSFANVIDKVTSTPDNLQWVPNLAHIKYYNKRGSGKMLNQLLHFDGQRKFFTESDAPLHDYPDFDGFVKQHRKDNAAGPNAALW